MDKVNGMRLLDARKMRRVCACANVEPLSAGHRGAELQRARDRVASVTGGDCRFVDEFELIRRCLRDRTVRRPDTVLGIGDDAALLDTSGLPLTHAWATVPFSSHDDATGIARRVFAAALLRLAARAVTPRWATLGLVLEAGDPGWLEPFSIAAAATCNACGVELIGGDTTRGPGRATVFALGAHRTRLGRIGPRPSTPAVAVRLPLATAGAPEHPIAEAVRVCTDLAGRGGEIRCEDVSDASHDTLADTLMLFAHTDAAGVDALRAAAGRLRPESRRLQSDD